MRAPQRDEGQHDIGSARASVVNNATWLSVATVAARVCSFGLAVILGRRLGVAEYGQYGFAAALGAIIAPLADIGISTYVYREVALNATTGRLKARRLASVKWCLSVFALVATAAIVSAGASSSSAAAVIVILVAALLADGYSAFIYGYFQGLERMAFQAKATVLSALARSLGGILCVLVFSSLLPVVIWILLVSTAQLALTWGGFTSSVGLRNRAELSARPSIQWRAVVTMGLLTLFALVSIRADSIMLGVIRNQHAVGIYTAAYTILGAIEIIPWQITQAIVPVFARTYASDQPRFLESWHSGVRIALLFSLPAALLTSILAQGILRLPYGPRFDEGAPALAILVWFAPLSVFNALLAGVLYGAHRERWPTIASGIGVAVNVLLNLWAIPRFGIVGAAAVTVATEVCVLLVQVQFLIGHRIAPAPRLPYARISLALLALATLAFALRPLPVILSASAALLGYAAVVVGTGVISRAELRSLRPGQRFG